MGYDEKGNRIRHWQREFSIQKETKAAYDEYMKNYLKTTVKTNSTMSYKELYETYFESDYKCSVGKSQVYHEIVFYIFLQNKTKKILMPSC